jgi:acyl-CoA thioester hydrolase
MRHGQSLTTFSGVSAVHEQEFRVRYAETDQMGVVYHTNYLVWCEMGRTELIRVLAGMSYAQLEEAGVLLAVSDLSIRYHGAARYDNMIRVRTSLAEARSRSVTFDYLITNAGSGERLATARTVLISIDRSGRPIMMPDRLRAALARVGKE